MVVAHLMTSEHTLHMILNKKQYFSTLPAPDNQLTAFNSVCLGCFLLSHPACQHLHGNVPHPTTRSICAHPRHTPLTTCMISGETQSSGGERFRKFPEMRIENCQSQDLNIK